MYGGKFFPFHTGHLMCIRKAAEMCERVYAILFANGEYERQVRRDHTVFNVDGYLSVERRFEALKAVANAIPNVIPVLIDVESCVKPDGSEDWDAETPLVIERCGVFDAVFSSEPSYGEYFRRAYPWAEHILIDPPRKIVPISATMIRSMNLNEAKEWLIHE